MLGGKAKGFGESAAGAWSINLTALMDILSNLLFFLLASYTAQDLEVKKANITLPASTSDQKVIPGLVVTVTRDEVLVADVPVAKVENGHVVGTDDNDERIEPLYERMRVLKSARVAAGYEGVEGSETLLLLADKTTDTAIITLVLKSAGAAGFVNVRFGVTSQ